MDTYGCWCGEKKREGGGWWSFIVCMLLYFYGLVGVEKGGISKLYG